MKRFRFFVIMMMTAMSLQSTCSFAGAGAHGGDIIDDDHPTEALVEESIQRAKTLLPFVLNYFEIQYKVYPNSNKSLSSPEENQIQALLFNHPENADVFAILQKTTFVPISGACVDKDGKHKDGATGYLGKDQVCFSKRRIRLRTTTIDVFRKVLVLSAHEMVHRMGGDEKKAKKFASVVNGMLSRTEIFDYVRWASTDFRNQVQNLNAAEKVIDSTLNGLSASGFQDQTVFKTFCNYYARQISNLKIPQIYDRENGWMGMAPVRANLAKVVFLIDEKIDMDELFCGGDADRRERIQDLWFGNATFLTSDQFAAIRKLPDNNDAPGVFRKPVLGDLSALSQEVNDVIGLTDLLER